MELDFTNVSVGDGKGVAGNVGVVGGMVGVVLGTVMGHISIVSQVHLGRMHIVHGWHVSLHTWDQGGVVHVCIWRWWW